MGSPLATLLRRLLLTAALLLSLAGHGAAMAQGAEPNAAAPQPAVHAMHHGKEAGCDAPRHCSESGKSAACCMVGHCLLGVMAEAGMVLPAFYPAMPEADPFLATAAAVQGAPERPPRSA